MKVWHAAPEDIEQAGQDAGVRVVGLRADGNGYRFTLKTHGPTSTGKPVQWGRVSQYARKKDGSPRRVPGAVCWHGHRAFMRALFAMAPDARLQSALADYHGRKDFEARHESTRGRRADDFGYGLRYADACDCEVDHA